jgi:hypothetical protein
VGVYDTSLPVGRGKEVGFVFAPNWFVVYLILFPPYIFVFGHVISRSKIFLAEASQPKRSLITNEEGVGLPRSEVVRKWHVHLRSLSLGLYVLLIGTCISSILQWIAGCLLVYWRSAESQYQGDRVKILCATIANGVPQDCEVVDWSTLAYVSQTDSAKLKALLFSVGAYSYMAIALFIYLAVLAYYTYLCWFVMRLASGSADPGTRLIIRGNQPFRYFSELFDYIYIATVLGLSAGYFMSLQAQYLNTAEPTIFAYAFTDIRCLVGIFGGNGFSECSPKAWREVSATLEPRGTASAFTSYGEAVYTITLFLASAWLLSRAFDLTKAHYLEKIGDPNWQRTVGIKYVASFVESIDKKGSFFSVVAPSYLNLSAALALIVFVLAVPYLGTVYLMTIVYAFVSLLRNRRRRLVDLGSTPDSIHTDSFKGTTIAEGDRKEIVLFLDFHNSSYPFGAFLENVIDEADIPQRFKNHIKMQIKKDGVDPADKLVEITLNYERLDAEKSTVLGNILVAMYERIGLDFGCFISVKSRNCGLVLDPDLLAKLKVACVKWNDARI